MDKTQEFTVKYNNNEYDITNFLKKHPGGINYLQKYKNLDITHKMMEPNHSKSATYLLQEYKKGETTQDNNGNNLENLVDWNKGVLSQVAILGDKYSEWIECPVDRKLRLFENNILESLTITPWFVVPTVWIPAIFYFLYTGIKEYTITNSSHTGTQIFWISHYIVCGFFLWTLIEYSLHRWLFHMNINGKSKIIVYIHFAIHGLHHKVPFDPGRLVFPPVPAAILLLIFYSAFSIIIPNNIIYLVMAGGLIGYVVYDMIHFYLHYGSPKEGTYLYHMKRYHNQHHFSHSNTGFGISSMLWDKIFGTTIQLKKLAVSIKW